MNTFLPHPSFKLSAMVLDDRRLNRQRVEVVQLLGALTLGGKLASHPAAKMWIGHEGALVWYGEQVCQEWLRRGFTDNMLLKLQPFKFLYRDRTLPEWLRDEAFRRSHQSNLIRKDPAHYRPRFPGVPENLPYVWPAPQSGASPEVHG